MEKESVVNLRDVRFEGIEDMGLDELEIVIKQSPVENGKKKEEKREKKKG